MKNCGFRSAAVTVFAVLSLLSSAAFAENAKTITNETFGFNVTYPSRWDAKTVSHADPLPDLEAFKSGKAALHVTGGSQGASAPNAVAFNQAQQTADPIPSMFVYAHEKKAQTFEQFSQTLAEYLKMLGGNKYHSAARVQVNGLEGFDYTYFDGPMRTRLVVFFANGKRYGLTYSDYGTGKFAAFAPEFETVMRSFQVRR